MSNSKNNTNNQQQQFVEQITDCGEEPTLCLCGCGDYTNWDRRRRIYNNFIYKHHLTAGINQGENNGMWKDNITYHAIHHWVNRNKPKPLDGLCELCRDRPYHDLANVSPSYNPDTYTRNFSNWRYLCRACHMISDGRLDRFFDSEYQSMCGRKSKGVAKSKKELVKH